MGSRRLCARGGKRLLFGRKSVLRVRLCRLLWMRQRNCGDFGRFALSSISMDTSGRQLKPMYLVRRSAGVCFQCRSSRCRCMCSGVGLLWRLWRGGHPWLSVTALTARCVLIWHEMVASLGLQVVVLQPLGSHYDPSRESEGAL